MELCGILLPYDINVYQSDEEPAECLLNRAHGDDHLCRLKDGRYILWESAMDCGCPEWPECDCYDFKAITAAEAMQILDTQIKQVGQVAT